MKKVFLMALLVVNAFTTLPAQSNTTRQKMAIFTPLYLDDAIDAAGSFKFNGNNFPKVSIPGLEFYHGAAIAIDSLNELNIPLDVYIYDSKSAKMSLESQLKKAAADGVRLVIANCSVSELGQYAKFAAANKITVINATAPNDGNVRNNPYFVVVNPTLPTQGEQIYAYIKKNYPGQPITFITRTGASEKYLRSVFETLNKTDKATAMHLKFVEVKDSLSRTQVQTHLGTGKSSVVVVGSLDNNFSERVLTQLSGLSRSYPQLTVVGMPTWENLNLSKFKGINVVYSTPFYNPKTDAASRNINSYYSAKMFARPSDLVFRAYGLTYRFGRLLNQYGDDMAAALSSKQFRVFHDYDIQPEQKESSLDYYENKKLYFLTYANGAFKEAR